MSALIPFLLVGFLVWYMTKERASYRRCVKDGVRAESTSLGVDPLVEPACQFPGVPEGWSLDRYARDGLQQIHIALVQASRRTGHDAAA